MEETLTKIPEQLKLDNQLCFPLYAAARWITSQYTPYLKPLGLTYTQYICLMVLWEKDSISVKELGQRLFLDSGTLTPVLKKMQDHGLVERMRAREDERVVMIRLTDEGRALMQEAAKVPGRVGSCVKLEGDEAMQLYALLYKLLGVERNA